MLPSEYTSETPINAYGVVKPMYIAILCHEMRTCGRILLWTRIPGATSNAKHMCKCELFQGGPCL
jgi:hypothetical protein